jgi:predicted HicB family RNase H-like nuclease
VIAQLRQDEFQAQLQAAQGQLDQARTALNALRLDERLQSTTATPEQVAEAVRINTEERLSPEQHRQIILAAEQAGKDVERWIAEALEQAVGLSIRDHVRA